ncbi:MAG TPA: glycosyltransferase family 2 protein [Thermoanaerobaculia bacterium]|jgi:glycosyltransferase involved in cell wall biosynthesis
MKLIVQIPAFNEEATIAQTLRDIPKKIDGITSIETLVIDDGSSDRTADAARKAGAHHILQLRTHRGLSSAFVAGIDAALRLGADIIVNTDADNQYTGADIAKLVAPIVKGTAEVVIGDREVAKSPHMSGVKRLLQRLGSWTVGLASGVDVADVTSGFRAFSRDAAMQINVFNPFTYTLETVIQAGNRNLGVQSVAIRTNAPTRPSRLYKGVGTYLRKSVATIFRIYTLYRPLKTFFALGSVLMIAGVALGARFLWYYLQGDRGGHIQSLILAAVFLITGFHTWLIALLADLIAVNRRLSEELLIRVKKLESPEAEKKPRREREYRERERDRERPAQPQPQPQPRRSELPPKVAKPAAATPAPAPAAAAPTQWVWLLDEDKLENRGNEPRNEQRAEQRNEQRPKPQAKPATPPPPPPISELDFDEDDEPETDTPEPAGDPTTGGSTSRRRRRRRGGVRQHADLPGNRGKHLAGGGEGERGE